MNGFVVVIGAFLLYVAYCLFTDNGDTEMKRCQSCGATFKLEAGGLKGLTEEQAGALKFVRKTRCEDCAREIVLGEVSKSALSPTTTMHDAGGGKRIIRDPRNMGG